MLDILLAFAISLMTIFSALLVLHPNNRYSMYTKILKTGPRLILGLQFLIAPFLANNVKIYVVDTQIYNLSTGFRVILWSLLWLWVAEICVQILNIKLGRAEKK